MAQDFCAGVAGECLEVFGTVDDGRVGCFGIADNEGDRAVDIADVDSGVWTSSDADLEVSKYKFEFLVRLDCGLVSSEASPRATQGRVPIPIRGKSKVTYQYSQEVESTGSINSRVNQRIPRCSAIAMDRTCWSIDDRSTTRTASPRLNVSDWSRSRSGSCRP